MKRIAIAGVAALIGVAALVLPSTTTSAQAASFSVTIGDDDLDELTGSVTSLGTFPTQGFAGQDCDVIALGGNNSSVHLNNNLIVTSERLSG